MNIQDKLRIQVLSKDIIVRDFAITKGQLIAMTLDNIAGLRWYIPAYRKCVDIRDEKEAEIMQNIESSIQSYSVIMDANVGLDVKIRIIIGG